MGPSKLARRIMRILIYNFFLSFSFASYNKCYKEAENKVKSCRRKVISTVASKIWLNFSTKSRALEGQKTSLRHHLCSKTLSTYEPNGLIREIPANWGCESDPLAFQIQKELTESPLIFEDGEDVYNIVIVGETGAGKSYFANGLLGAKYPGRRNTL